MYFQRNREFGSAFQNFGISGGGGGVEPPNPPPLGTPQAVPLLLSFEILYCNPQINVRQE
jgi:hypothetical protein